MPGSLLRIVTRKSPLALWQADHVGARLRSLHDGLSVETIGVTTEADRFLDRSLAAMGGKGLFIKELEQALLDGRADIAVHSMKDVPVELAHGLVIAAILRRDDPRDVLICRGPAGLYALPAGARVGTSSLRRRSQLLHRRPDLKVEEVRGNVGSRLKKLDRGEFDALVLAAAGLTRLGYGDRIGQLLPTEIMLPAIGQGALGIECRSDDPHALECASPLNDPDSRRCVSAERAVNRRLFGGCHLPIAGYAQIVAGELRLQALIAALDGDRILRASGSGDPERAEDLGVTVGELLLAQGGNELI
ncbi:MAG: hydroxymethylbilane synthase, partial [Longimicrobiales bacterium]